MNKTNGQFQCFYYIDLNSIKINLNLVGFEIYIYIQLLLHAMPFNIFIQM
jgi:hypothetical protein